MNIKEQIEVNHIMHEIAHEVINLHELKDLINKKFLK